MSSLAGLVLECEPGPGRLETWISDGFGRSRNLLKDVEICEHRKQDRHVMSCRDNVNWSRPVQVLNGIPASQ